MRPMPAILLRGFTTPKLVAELRRRARAKGIEQSVPFREESLPAGCRLRNHCGPACDDLRCPMATRD